MNIEGWGGLRGRTLVWHVQGPEFHPQYTHTHTYMHRHTRTRADTTHSPFSHSSVCGGVVCTCTHTEARGHLASCTVILHVVSGDRSLSEPRARPSSIVLGLWARLAIHGFLRGCWKMRTQVLLYPLSHLPVSPFLLCHSVKCLGLGLYITTFFHKNKIYFINFIPKETTQYPGILAWLAVAAEGYSTDLYSGFLWFFWGSQSWPSELLPSGANVWWPSPQNLGGSGDL